MIKIKVVLENCLLMLITIKTLTGRKINYTSDDDSIIRNIKEFLQEKEGIELSQIRLIYGGKQLNDMAKVTNELKPGDVIHMILALRGGGKKSSKKSSKKSNNDDKPINKEEKPVNKVDKPIDKIDKPINKVDLQNNIDNMQKKLDKMRLNMTNIELKEDECTLNVPYD